MLLQTLDQSVKQSRLEDVQGRQGAQEARLSALLGRARHYGLHQTPVVETQNDGNLFKSSEASTHGKNFIIE